MRALGRALAVVGLVTGLVSCGSAPGLTHDLSGYVRDADTGAAIAGAAVTFRTDTLRDYDTTSGSDGLYRILVDVDVPFGEVSATKAGFDPVMTSVYFDTDVRRVDLPMHKQAM